MSSNKDLAIHQVKAVYPKWDKATQRFSNHYRTEELLNVLDLITQMQFDMEQVAATAEVRIPVIKLARVITKMHNPPSSVTMWIHRVLRIFYHAPLVKALKEGTISARFALSDIANRLYTPKYNDMIDKACRGVMSNAEFRTQLKLTRE